MIDPTLLTLTGEVELMGRRRKKKGKRGFSLKSLVKKRKARKAPIPTVTVQEAPATPEAAPIPPEAAPEPAANEGAQDFAPIPEETPAEETAPEEETEAMEGELQAYPRGDDYYVGLPAPVKKPALVAAKKALIVKKPENPALLWIKKNPILCVAILAGAFFVFQKPIKKALGGRR